MKTILAPTDYSESSINALNYAISLAKQFDSKIILLHVFSVPVIPVDIAIVSTYLELEKNYLASLKLFEKELREKSGYGIEIECLVKSGPITDEIQNLVTERSVDLIVMAIEGAGKLSELLVGSTTTSVIQKVDCSTLVIPVDARFRPVKNIALASDLSKIEHGTVLHTIKNIVKLFKSKLLIVNVVDPSKGINFEHAVLGKTVADAFEGIDHSLFIQGNNDLVYGITDFIDHHTVDMLIMVPKHHSFFSRLFHESETKKMIFHTHVPLLAVHE